jgi:hypothetical protein
LQQQENRSREGLITSLAKYRARSALLAGVVGGAEAIGAGFSDAFKLGGGDTGYNNVIRSDSVRFATMNLLADHFDFGGLFSQVQGPITRSAQRAGDITTAIARAGGRVTPELRGSLRDLFIGQEQRVESEKRQIEATFSDKETLGQALTDTKLGEVIDKLSTSIDSLKQGLENLLKKAGF